MLTDSKLDRLLDIEVGRHEAFIALDDRGIAGVARYARDETDPTTTEVAILVADEWQHRGVTRELMRPLMTGARDAGIKRFRAEILPENSTAEISGPVMRRRLARHVGGRVIRSEERPKLDRAQESWPAGAIVD